MERESKESRSSSSQDSPIKSGDILEQLKQIYFNKIKPLEDEFCFDHFYWPSLTDSDFDSNAMVLLLGQYSTGKTSFIRFLLEEDYPGMRISPEPTTDCFIAIMRGEEKTQVHGHSLTVQCDKPFQGLSKFGDNFLNKFQGSYVTSPNTENIIFIDTPGILSGAKQKLGRSYDFCAVVEWFASKSDLILLLFDPFKLDISDEFKDTINVLHRHSKKIRVILNKADNVSSQELLRVHGALMWSLGKVFETPEVIRVYVGSFWDEKLKNVENRALFEAEKKDLLDELSVLPNRATERKLNELVKRARLALTHARIMNHLGQQMPKLWGKASTQQHLMDNLQTIFKEIQNKYNLPAGDFPSIQDFKEKLVGFDLSLFRKEEKAEIFEGVNQALTVDIPKLQNMRKKVPEHTGFKRGYPEEKEASEQDSKKRKL